MRHGSRLLLLLLIELILLERPLADARSIASSRSCLQAEPLVPKSLVVQDSAVSVPDDVRFRHTTPSSSRIRGDSLSLHGIVSNELTRDMPEVLITDHLSVVLMERCLRIFSGNPMSDEEFSEKLRAVMADWHDPGLASQETKAIISLLESLRFSYDAEAGKGSIAVENRSAITFRIEPDGAISLTAPHQGALATVKRLGTALLPFVILLAITPLMRSLNTFFTSRVVSDSTGGLNPVQTLWTRDTIGVSLFLGVYAVKRFVQRNAAPSAGQPWWKKPLTSLRVFAITMIDRWIETLLFYIGLVGLPITMTLPAYRMSISSFTTFFGLALFRQPGEKVNKRLLAGVGLLGASMLSLSLVLLGIDIGIGLTFLTAFSTGMLIVAGAGYGLRMVFAKSWKDIDDEDIGVPSTDLAFASFLTAAVTMLPLLLWVIPAINPEILEGFLHWAPVAPLDTGFSSAKIWITAVVKVIDYIVFYWALKKLTGRFKEITMGFTPMVTMFLTVGFDLWLGDLQKSPLQMLGWLAVGIVMGTILLMKSLYMRHTDKAQPPSEVESMNPHLYQTVRTHL